SDEGFFEIRYTLKDVSNPLSKKISFDYCSGVIHTVGNIYSGFSSTMIKLKRLIKYTLHISKYNVLVVNDFVDQFRPTSYLDVLQISRESI
ncbi:hypothetical protein BY458DRAFT_513274, partial [Sporodiniella umbellata]